MQRKQDSIFGFRHYKVVKKFWQFEKFPGKFPGNFPGNIFKKNISLLLPLEISWKYFLEIFHWKFPGNTFPTSFPIS
jgi:hypothetical protein